MSIDLALAVLLLFGFAICGITLSLITSPWWRAGLAIGVAFHPLLLIEWGQGTSWLAVERMLFRQDLLEGMGVLVFVEALIGLGLVLVLHAPEGHRRNKLWHILLCLPPVPLIVAQHLAQLRVFHYAVQQSFTALAVSVAVGSALLLLLAAALIRHRCLEPFRRKGLVLLLVIQGAAGILLPPLLGETESPESAMSVDWTAMVFFLIICSVGLSGGALRARQRRM